eukprot:604917-Amphidinium_carterae.1
MAREGPEGQSSEQAEVVRALYRAIRDGEWDKLSVWSRREAMGVTTVIYDILKKGGAAWTDLVRAMCFTRGVDVSVSWCRAFLKSIDLSHKTSNRGGPPPTEGESFADRPFFAQKLVWTMNEYHVGYKDVYNIDETACHLLLVKYRGWFHRGKDNKAHWTWDKQFLTCTLICQPSRKPNSSPLLPQKPYSSCGN